MPYLFSLLGISEPGSPLQQIDPQIRRRRTFEAIKRLLLRESLNQPLLLLFEDLHWVDSETQAFLDILSESVASARILLLVTYRPEYRHSWGSKTYYTQLRLDPLGREDAQEILSALLGDGAGLVPLRKRTDKPDGPESHNGLLYCYEGTNITEEIVVNNSKTQLNDALIESYRSEQFWD